MNIRIVLLGGFLFLGTLFPDSFAQSVPLHVPIRTTEGCSDEESDDDSEPGHSLEKGFNRALSGDLDGAERHFLAALDEHTDDALALSNLATVFAARGDGELALIALGDALAIEPDFRLALANLATINATFASPAAEA